MIRGLLLVKSGGAAALPEWQKLDRWDPFEPPRTALDTRLGVMGLGNIGQVAARMLRGLGFAVAGWVRTESRAGRDLDGIEVHAGAGELDHFLSRSDILVGLLPETPQTLGLVASAGFRAAPESSMPDAGR